MVPCNRWHSWQEKENQDDWKFWQIVEFVILFLSRFDRDQYLQSCISGCKASKRGVVLNFSLSVVSLKYTHCLCVLEAHLMAAFNPAL